MLRRILKKMRNDRGSASLISFILLVPLFLGLVITAVDLTFYFTNRNQVQAIARDAARTIAIYGGNGSTTQTTSIQNKYGVTKTTACSAARLSGDLKDAPNKYLFSDTNKTNYTGTECNVLAALANSTGLVSFSLDSKDTGVAKAITCGPIEASSIGSRTYCNIVYAYKGMPGAPLSFVQIRHDNGSTSGLLSVNKVNESSESEVKNPGLMASQ